MLDQRGTGEPVAAATEETAKPATSSDAEILGQFADFADLAFSGATALNPVSEPGAASTDESASDEPGEDETLDLEPVSSDDDGAGREQQPSEEAGREGESPQQARRREARERRERELVEAQERGAAAERERLALQAENDRLVSEQQRIAGEALGRLGTEDEYAALQAEARQHGLNGTIMPEDKATRLQSMDAWREIYRPFLQDADVRVRRYYAMEGFEAAKELQVPMETILEAAKTGHARVVNRAFYQAGAASREAEVKVLKDEVAALKTEQKALLNRTAGMARAPERGGDAPPVSAPNGRPTFDPTKPMQDLMLGALEDLGAEPVLSGRSRR